jgi:hypothetical protein
MSGFGTSVRDNVEVGLNQTRVANVQLSPSARAETVTVTGATHLVKTVNAEVKNTLSSQDSGRTRPRVRTTPPRPPIVRITWLFP